MSDIKKIKVGMASCGIAAGANSTYETLKEIFSDIDVQKTGCIGMCFREPLVEIVYDDGRSIIYGDVTSERAVKLRDALKDGKSMGEWIVYIPGDDKYEKSRYFQSQTKIVLRNSGIINPESIDEYIAQKGYNALKKALEMDSDKVIEEITNSGLRGRGGAGFPAGLKWKFTRQSKADKKYIICNADEGDPGAFMDRSILEGDPHSVIEGMIIAGFAIGSDTGYIYVRAEYPLAIKRLEIALEQAKKGGFLSDNILGSNFSFDIKIKKGAGAFVCGEETALMKSIEGNRGMPSLKPPFPAQSGLWRKPTNINNVETFANVPWIINEGAEKFAAIGTEKSKGTKVFALTGKINNSGTVEVPMGISLREVIFDVGGGIIKGNKFKAVQIGGPSGGCVPESMIDTPVDYDSLNATGAIMGSGGMVVMDEFSCMVDVAKFFLGFIVDESCGKCTFCRLGNKRMHEILDRITKGKGELSDLEELEVLCDQVKNGSLCGLGQTAPNPVLTSLRYFKDEYIDHIANKKCPAGVCKALIEYEIIPDKCTGCTLCTRDCPANAISGEVKKVHVIDQNTCIKCNRCFEICRFDAVKRV